MASTCSMSLSAFKRQFMLEFGEAPTAWMQKQLLGEIKYKLSVTDLPLGTIANELGSPPLRISPNIVKDVSDILPQS